MVSFRTRIYHEVVHRSDQQVQYVDVLSRHQEIVVTSAMMRQQTTDGSRFHASGLYKKKIKLLDISSVAKSEDLVNRYVYFPNRKKCKKNVLNNCIEYILENNKKEKEEDFLIPCLRKIYLCQHFTSIRLNLCHL